MAISKSDEHIEMRIKRPPADSLSTYFEEYADPKRSEGPDDKVCESYIVAGEHDAQYLIEVILRPGFKPYGANDVLVHVWLEGMPRKRFHISAPKSGKGGLTDEKTVHIDRWTVEEKGVEMGKKLAFNRLKTAPGLESGTTVLGLDPVSLGVIRIEVERTISSLKNVKRERTRIDSFKNGRAENDVGSRILADSPDDNSQRLLMIDEKLGKPENGGLTHSTKLVDEDSRQRRKPKLEGKHARPAHDRIGPVKFLFKYRTQDVLERLGIVKKPPPLMEWAWDDLNLLDRPTVFKQLQKDNKKYDMKEWEMKIRGGVEDKEPPEWQAYSKIKNRDRKRLFEILQENNKAYIRRDGRRDVKFQVKHLEYEQGPEGWQEHDDMHAIAANKPDLVTDCGKGAVVTEPPVPKEQPTQTVISCVDADSLPAAPAEADVVRNSASSNQQDKMQAHKRCRSPSDPIIKAEPIVKAELVVKAEPSTATNNLGTSHQEPTSKRRKIADTHTHSTKPANRPKLFSTTIDITGDAPMVKPKPLTTIDLTEDFSPLIQPEEPNNASTLSTAGRPPVKQELSPTPSTPVNTEPSHPSNSRQMNPVSVKEEPSTSSRTSIDAAPQPSRSGPGFAMLTPTEIAEQGGC